MTRYLLLLLFALALLLAVALAQDSPPRPASPSPRAAKHQVAGEGEKRFYQHCGRCHTAPVDIPSRAAGTVLRHMRVRATLTAEDERLILQYIAP